MVAFVVTTVLIPTSAMAATPGAIPPSALPACGTESPTGGWVLRDFVANGAAVESDDPTRPKGLRLGEPCLDGMELALPVYVRDLSTPGGDWTDNGGIATGPDGSELPLTADGFFPRYAQTFGAGDTPGTNYCKWRGDVYVNYNGSCVSPYYFTVQNSFELGTPASGTYTFGSSTTGTIHATRLGGNGPAIGGYRPADVYCANTATGLVQKSGTSEKGTNDANGYTINSGYTAPWAIGQTIDFEVSCPTGSVIVHWTFFSGNWTGSSWEPEDFIPADILVPLSSKSEGWFAQGLPNAPETSDEGGGPRLGGKIAGTILFDGAGGLSDQPGYVVCASSPSGEATNNVPIVAAQRYDKDYPASMNDPDGYEPTFEENLHIINDYPCPYIKEIYVTICRWITNGLTTYSCIQTVWTFTAYQAATPYGDGTLEDSICTDGTEIPGECNGVLYPDPNAPDGTITCEIEYSDPGNPITNIGEFFGGLGPFIGCLFTPEGWDRAGKISKTWNNGPVAKLVGAFQDQVPDGITCGHVGDMPMPNGTTLALDTCGADVAPAGVKTVIGWVIVLGTCALIIRRIMWSVGSKG